MSFSDVYENYILDCFFRYEPFLVPQGAYHFGLAADVTDSSIPGQTLQEPPTYAPHVTGYYRRSFDPFEWDVSVSGSITNLVVIEWQALQDWGRITHLVVFDAGAVGNMVCYARLSQEWTIQANDWITFNPGDIVFRLD